MIFSNVKLIYFNWKWSLFRFAYLTRIVVHVNRMKTLSWLRDRCISVSFVSSIKIQRHQFFFLEKIENEARTQRASDSGPMIVCGIRMYRHLFDTFTLQPSPQFMACIAAVWRFWISVYSQTPDGVAKIKNANNIGACATF